MKNVLITGACSGMGLAATKLFLKRGWGVIMTDLSQEKGIELHNELKKEYDSVWFKAANVAKSESVKALYDFTVENKIKIDSLINNAGVFTAGKLHEISEENFDFIFDVDVKSIFLTGKYFIPDMIKNGGGTIVNTASVSGMEGDYDMAAYNAAKGAVVNLVRSMALDYGRYNIRVNNVCPSACATPMFLSNPQEVIDQFSNANPLKRICTPEEVAKAMYFLASDESSSTNGLNLTVSGGLEVHTGQPVQDDH